MYKKSNHWHAKMVSDLLGISSYVMKCIPLIDESNYFDLIKSIEKKAKNLRIPKG